jgi:hypothetical protein
VGSQLPLSFSALLVSLLMFNVIAFINNLVVGNQGVDDAAAAAEVASQPIVYLIPVAAEQQSAVFNPQSTEADEQSSAVEEQSAEQEGCRFDADEPPVAEDTSDDGNIELVEQEYYQPPLVGGNDEGNDDANIELEEQEYYQPPLVGGDDAGNDDANIEVEEQEYYQPPLVGGDDAGNDDANIKVEEQEYDQPPLGGGDDVGNDEVELRVAAEAQDNFDQQSLVLEIDEEASSYHGSDASNADVESAASVPVNAAERDAAKVLIANHPVKRMERLKGWKKEQIQAAALRNNENLLQVSDFLIALFNFHYCFDRVHCMFKNCTCLNDLNRALIPTISSTLGM